MESDDPMATQAESFEYAIVKEPVTKKSLRYKVAAQDGRTNELVPHSQEAKELENKYLQEIESKKDLLKLAGIHTN